METKEVLEHINKNKDSHALIQIFKAADLELNGNQIWIEFSKIPRDPNIGFDYADVLKNLEVISFIADKADKKTLKKIYDLSKSRLSELNYEV